MSVSVEQLSVLNQRLRSSDVNQRRLALAELEEDLEIVPAELLIPSLRDEDAAVRRLAAQLLEEILRSFAKWFSPVHCRRLSRA